MEKLLFDDEPLVVSPKGAKVFGLNESIIMQQLWYWQRKSKHEYLGRKWIYNTYEDWQKQFPFWSVRTIKRIIENLVASDLVLKANFNKSKLDKTNWYTLKIDKFIDEHNRPSIVTKWHNGECQTDTMDSDNLTQAIPENTQKKPKTTISHEKESLVDISSSLVDLYHSICISLPRVLKLTDKRKKQIQSRIKDGYSVEQIKNAFQMIEQSDFLRGENSRCWKADFDWIFANDTNLSKILEGKYSQQVKKIDSPAYAN